MVDPVDPYESEPEAKYDHFELEHYPQGPKRRPYLLDIFYSGIVLTAHWFLFHVVDRIWRRK